MQNVSASFRCMMITGRTPWCDPGKVPASQRDQKQLSNQSQQWDDPWSELAASPLQIKLTIASRASFLCLAFVHAHEVRVK
jgi:hypothetical protein